MKVLIVSKSQEPVKALLAAHGDFFEIVEKSPDVVMSYGGDGMLLTAEHRYPGVPKLYLKNSRVAKLAHQSKENKEIIAHVARGEYSIEEMMKLEAKAKGKTFIGVNDIVLHNENPRHGIRYTVAIDGVSLRHEVIGDGIVLATPLGSTAYYRSITDSSFETGIGLAFNNSTEQSDHMVLAEDRLVRIEITRGPAICYADNQEESVRLLEGDSVEIKKSAQVARMIRV